MSYFPVMKFNFLCNFDSSQNLNIEMKFNSLTDTKSALNINSHAEIYLRRIALTYPAVWRRPHVTVCFPTPDGHRPWIQSAVRSRTQRAGEGSAWRGINEELSRTRDSLPLRDGEAPWRPGAERFHFQDRAMFRGYGQRYILPSKCR